MMYLYLPPKQQICINVCSFTAVMSEANMVKDPSVVLPFIRN